MGMLYNGTGFSEPIQLIYTRIYQVIMCIQVQYAILEKGNNSSLTVVHVQVLSSSFLSSILFVDNKKKKKYRQP